MTVLITIPEWMATALFWWVVLCAGGVLILTPSVYLFLKSQHML